MLGLLNKQLLDCTWLGVATLCNHSVPLVDVSIAEGLDFFRQLLVPTASFPLLFRIWPVEGSIGAGQLCSSNHPLHFPDWKRKRNFWVHCDFFYITGVILITPQLYNVCLYNNQILCSIVLSFISHNLVNISVLI